MFALQSAELIEDGRSDSKHRHPFREETEGVESCLMQLSCGVKAHGREEFALSYFLEKSVDPPVTGIHAVCHHAFLLQP